MVSERCYLNDLKRLWQEYLHKLIMINFIFSDWNSSWPHQSEGEFRCWLQWSQDCMPWIVSLMYKKLLAVCKVKPIQDQGFNQFYILFYFLEKGSNNFFPNTGKNIHCSYLSELLNILDLFGIIVLKTPIIQRYYYFISLIYVKGSLITMNSSELA